MINVPYNTGAMKIGCKYEPPAPRMPEIYGDAALLQLALLKKPRSGSIFDKFFKRGKK